MFLHSSMDEGNEKKHVIRVIYMPLSGKNR